MSKSGTLTYQMMFELRDFGFSTAIGIGGDPIIGTTHIDALEAFEDDPDTKAIVMIGEIGGDAEERAAAYIKDHVTKPVVGYVAGFTAPEGKTMGHAGAIVSGSSGTAQAKKEALEAAGVKVGKTPSETAAADAGDPAGAREMRRVDSRDHDRRDVEIELRVQPWPLRRGWPPTGSSASSGCSRPESARRALGSRHEAVQPAATGASRPRGDGGRHCRRSRIR